MKRISLALAFVVIANLLTVNKSFATEIVIAASEGVSVTDYDVKQRAKLLEWIQAVQKRPVEKDDSYLYHIALQQMKMELLQRGFMRQKNIDIPRGQIINDMHDFLRRNGLSVEDMDQQFKKSNISYETFENFITGQIINMIIMQKFVAPYVRITKQEVIQRANLDRELTPNEFAQFQQEIMQEKAQKEFRNFMMIIRRQFFVEQVK